jgi:hypothetical protein
VATARTPLGRLTAEQLIQQIERTEAASASNTYALGACLAELALPKRYKDELGFATFEELLEKRKLPSRMTAFKLMRVVAMFSDAEVQRLGGMEKTYALMRYAKRMNIADPRKYLAPSARVGGTSVSNMSVRDIHSAIRSFNGDDGAAAETSSAAHRAATKASSALGRALKRVGLKHRMRVHAHGDECVSAHFDAATAAALASMLTKLKKLEKAATKTKKPT